MDISTLILEEDAELPELLAVDTTFLISANSALFPTERTRLRDSDCDETFSSLLTYLCNGKKFSYVRPGTDAITKFPILNLVEKTGAKAKTLFLTPQGTEETYKKVTQDFIDFINKGFASDVANWVRFQFDDDDFEKIFFDGDESKQIDRMLEARDYLRHSYAHSEISAKWLETGIETLSLPPKHQSVASKEFESKSEYALTYGFFGFAKGLFYPLQLSHNRKNCIHWLRKYPMQREEQRSSDLGEYSNKGLTDPPDKGLVFDWGKVLLNFGRKSKNLADFQAQLPEMVKVLSSETTVEKLVEILESSRGVSDLEKAIQIRRQAAEDFVISTLLKTSWHPKLIDIKGHKKRKKAIAAATTIAVGLIGGLTPGIIGAGVLLTGAKYLNMTVDSRWYAKAEAWTTKRFTREKLWSRIDGSDIAPTIEEFIRKKNL